MNVSGKQDERSLALRGKARDGKAAAVTMAECEVGCPPPDDVPETVTMRLDRPFGFAIKGLSGEGLLFMGVVRKM